MTTPPISGSASAPVRTATADSATKATKVAAGAAATTAATGTTSAAAPAKFSTVLGAKVKQHAARAETGVAAQTPHVVAAKKVGKALASARSTAPAEVVKTEKT